MAAALLAVTFVLVLLGCGLWAAGYVGWAQLVFVVGSGTAGGGIVGLVEGRW